ncbi:MAG: radical SAM protein [Bacteroidales bacterium]
MRYLKIMGGIEIIPPYPHHKNFVYRSRIFFKANNLFNLFAINGVSYALKRKWLQFRHGYSIPYILLIDPTSACNLKCTGCWAADYSKTASLSYEKLDEILTDAKRLGVYDIVFSGGEPLMRKNDILRLCKKHDKLSFAMFTNGTLIDENFADEMVKLGNLNVFISIEGFKEKTDFRRGEGTFDKVSEVMDLLKSKGIGYGFSICYHSKNSEEISSDSFLDFLRAKGAWIGWLFNYMPIGMDADTSLVATPSQRRLVYERIMDYQIRNDFTLIDFANMGHFAFGCVAAGNEYAHINSNGDLEPCAFFHYSDSNLNEVRLKKALNSPFYRHFRKLKPFSSNPFLPCPIMDNPDKLEELSKCACVKSTHLQHPESLHELSLKTKPVSLKWKPVADELFLKLDDSQKKKIKLFTKFLMFKEK